MQTSSMIKQTSHIAPDREQEINSLIHQANLNNDPYVKEFGLTISNSMMKVSGRVLPPPKLQYGGGTSLDQVQITQIYIPTTYNFHYVDHFYKKPVPENILKNSTYLIL